VKTADPDCHDGRWGCLPDGAEGRIVLVNPRPPPVPLGGPQSRRQCSLCEELPEVSGEELQGPSRPSHGERDSTDVRCSFGEPPAHLANRFYTTVQDLSGESL